MELRLFTHDDSIGKPFRNENLDHQKVGLTLNNGSIEPSLKVHKLEIEFKLGFL